ncbi:MAG: coenzyme F420-0:L-glutamate ligase [Candidatus Bathyarchaeia archaeon]|jgi:F420-0:gamma-glutamyl ligase-like protein
MTGLKVLAIPTEYWRPGEDYLKETVKAVRGKVVDDDFVVVSEKAISAALNNIVDESKVKPGLGAKFIASFWMRTCWGYFLGPLCHLRQKLLLQLRNYPLEMGSRHKQVALQHAGFLQALMFGSEGGIDGSNLPYSYVSLPLNRADEVAETIRLQIWAASGKRVFVMIADTDKTYSVRNFHFTPRPNPFRGIHSFGGFAAYVVGRMLKLERRATPLALAGCSMSPGVALRVAEAANRARGFGAGRTVWDMAETFRVSLADVSWQMLETVRHKPIVIVRKSGEMGGWKRKQGS